MRKQDKTNPLKASLLAAAMVALPLPTMAAGLAQITVLSALGQPLRAELDVTASRDELSSLTARIASAEAFRQANIDYPTVLGSLRFSLEKRSNGQPYFKITSDRPVNEPFLDFLVELNWSSGRLVREYTFLLDPPESAQAQKDLPSSAPVLPEAGAQTGEVAPLPTPTEKPAAVPSGAKASAHTHMPTPPRQAERSGTAGERVVKSGETLGSIATEVRPEGVSLDQMLVAMFRANPNAFDGDNMNRLRAGRVLSIPEASAVESVGSEEARKIVMTHAADFGSYRKKLAAAAASAPATASETPRQEASGKLAPKVADTAPPVTAGSDKLEVSRTGTSKAPAPHAGAKAKEEDQVAREKALQEANSRIAALEKNLGDLKKLDELKGQDTGRGPSAKTETPPPAPSATPKTEVAPPKPVHKVTPPPPPPPSFLEQYAPFLLGGGGLLALLGAYFGYSMWRRKRSAEEGEAKAFVEPGLAAASLLDPDAEPAVSADLNIGVTEASEAGAEIVDPLQEAEVYLAYGRDNQAEEILLEALKTTPTRLAIHSKLLDIYAARKSVPQFLTLARDVQEQTGGQGAEWEHAVELGRVVAPDNPLFGGQVLASPPPVEDIQEPQTSAPVEETAQADAAREDERGAVVETVPDTLDFDLDLAAQSPEQVSAPAEAAGLGELDFDLGLGEPAQAEEAAKPEESVAKEEDALDIDFNLDLPGDAPAETAPVSESATNAVDFDLGEEASVAQAPAVVAEEKPLDALDFDFDLGEPAASVAEAPAPALDLADISLDLDAPAVSGDAAQFTSPDSADVATKLELALAYQEMGDKEGARELLEEVLKEGSAAQQELARGKLAALA